MRRGFAIVAAALVLLAGVGAAQMTVNIGADATPDPYIADTPVEQAEHAVDTPPLTYESNDGSMTTMEAIINESDEDHPNPFTFSPAKVNASDYRKFPHGADTTWSNQSEWSGYMPAETETAPGVDAVQFNLQAGNTSTFSNFSVQSDESKRYGQVVAQVDSLGASTEVEVRFNDSDGDYKVAYINSSKDRGSDDVIANATGAVVWQHQLGDLSTMTTAGSDGTFDNIEEVEVHATGGSATVTLVGLNADKMSEWQYGTMQYHADDDDTLEEKTLTEPMGAVSIDSLDSMGPTFDDAVLHDLEIPVQFTASATGSEDVNVTVRPAGNRYPSYDHEVIIQTRLEAPDQYDLTHHNLSLKDEQTLPGDRYVSVEVAEGVGDTEFGNVSDSTYSSVTTAYANGAEGDVHELDGTVQPGQVYEVKMTLSVTSGDLEDMSAASSSGGGGYYEDSNKGGGILQWVLGGIASLFGGLMFWRGRGG